MRAQEEAAVALDFASLDHEAYMREALHEASEAGRRGDRPIGAVIVHEGTVVGRGSSRWKTINSDVHHAENTAVFAIAPFLKEHARECVIYTTVEPCIMCLSTIVLANIRSIVFGLKDNYMASERAIASVEHLRVRVRDYLGGVLAAESRDLFLRFGFEDDLRVITEGRH